jgi:hypothetical protein
VLGLAGSRKGQAVVKCSVAGFRALGTGVGTGFPHRVLVVIVPGTGMVLGVCVLSRGEEPCRTDGQGLHELASGPHVGVLLGI